MCVRVGGGGVVFVLKSRVGLGIFINRSVPVDSRLCRCYAVWLNADCCGGDFFLFKRFGLFARSASSPGGERESVPSHLSRGQGR